MFPLKTLPTIHLSSRLKRNNCYIDLKVHPSENLLMIKRKKIVTSILSALLLGLFMGLFMLYLFPNIGGEDPKQIPTMGVQDEEDKGQDSNDNLINYKVDTLTAYVLQGGMFSNYDNAEQWLNTFKNINLHPVLWERDSYFYLFVGLAPGKEEAEDKKRVIPEEGVDIYVKDWNVDGIDVLVFKDEQEWLESFQKKWLHTLEDHKEFSSWDILLDKASALEDIKSSSQQMDKLFDQYDYSIEAEADYLLLETWKEFEELIKILKDRRM